MYTWRFVEILEMRIAPAATTFIWDGPAGGSWMNPVNWVGDIARHPVPRLFFRHPIRLLLVRKSRTTFLSEPNSIHSHLPATARTATGCRATESR